MHDANKQESKRGFRVWALGGIAGGLFIALCMTLFLVGCTTPGGVRVDEAKYAQNRDNASTMAEQGSKSSHSLPYIDPDFRLAPNDVLGLSYYTRHEPLPEYLMQIGDTLLIEFHQQEYLNRNVIIQPDGRIPMPYIAQFASAGKTSDAVGAELTDIYKADGIFNNVQITVSVLAFNTRLREMQANISNGITGQVREVTVGQDGYIVLPMARNVLVAGNPLDFVREDIRAAYNTALPGASVDVELRTVGSNFLYVLGEVLNPGLVSIREPMGVVQAITAAGGYRPGADLSTVAVLRADDGNCPVGRIVNVRRILNEGSLADDVMVRRFDVIYVPPHNIKKLNDGILMYVRNMMPLESTMTMNFDYMWGNDKNFSPF